MPTDRACPPTSRSASPSRRAMRAGRRRADRAGARRRSSPTTAIRRSIEQLLAEALVLTALLGSLLKDPAGQMTLQAQTENGIVDLLVCDYLGGELRGYVRHDRRAAGRAPGRTRRCSPCSARAIWRSPSTSRRPTSATRGSSRWRARAWPRRRKAISPSRSRSRASSAWPRDKRDGGWVAGGLLFQHLPEGEEGRDRLHTRLDHPDWPHVAILAGSVQAGGADRSRAAARRPGLAPVPRGGRGAHAASRCALTRGCRCDPDYVRSVIARFPAEERAGDGRRRRHDPGRLRILLDELPDRARRVAVSES